MERIDEILQNFKRWAIDKTPIDADTWLDAALHLNVLVEDIDDEITHMDFQMAEEECRIIADGESAAAAKRTCIQAVDYETYLKLKSKRTRIDEFIRLAKKKAQLSNDRYKSSL